jgi:CHAD domain-containing protein
MDHPMTAISGPAREEFYQTVLRQRADALLAEFNALKGRPAEEAIHDTRVQSRRMRAALEAFQDLLAPHPWQALYESVREITQTLGRPRETGVMLVILHDLGDTRDMAESLCREYLIDRVRRRLHKQEKKLMARLNAIDPVRLRSRIEFLLSGMELPADGDDADVNVVRPAGAPRQPRRRRATIAPALPAVAGNVHERARAIFSRLAQPILAFRPRYDFRRASEEQIHGLRISAKKLRYAMEIFDPIWPGGLRDRITDARALQDAGGHFHDWCVLTDQLKAEIRRLDTGETSHLAFQIGRLLALAEDRRAELRKQILPAIKKLQATLQIPARFSHQIS